MGEIGEEFAVIEQIPERGLRLVRAKLWGVLDELIGGKWAIERGNDGEQIVRDVWRNGGKGMDRQQLEVSEQDSMRF